MGQLRLPFPALNNEDSTIWFTPLVNSSSRPAVNLTPRPISVWDRSEFQPRSIALEPFPRPRAEWRLTDGNDVELSPTPIYTIINWSGWLRPHNRDSHVGRWTVVIGTRELSVCVEITTRQLLQQTTDEQRFQLIYQNQENARISLLDLLETEARRNLQGAPNVNRNEAVSRVWRGDASGQQTVPQVSREDRVISQRATYTFWRNQTPGRTAALIDDTARELEIYRPSQSQIDFYSSSLGQGAPSPTERIDEPQVTVPRLSQIDRSSAGANSHHRSLRPRRRRVRDRTQEG